MAVDAQGFVWITSPLLALALAAFVAAMLLWAQRALPGEAETAPARQPRGGALPWPVGAATACSTRRGLSRLGRPRARSRPRLGGDTHSPGFRALARSARRAAPRGVRAAD